MDIIEINSFNQLKSELEETDSAYLLLYKSGSENSECAFRSLKKAAENIQEIKLMAADVKKVRDIHTEYNIKSAPSLLQFSKGKFKSNIKGCNSDEYYTNLIQQNLYVAERKEGEDAKQKPVTVYTTPTCPHCTTLKTHLKTYGIKFTDIDVSKDQSAAQRMMQKSGQQGVPQADIGGEVIVGFNKSRINELLNIN